MTRSSFRDECDVNHIVKRYAETGLVNSVPRTPAQYGYVPETTFYDAARVQAAIKSSEAEERANSMFPETQELPEMPITDPAEIPAETPPAEPEQPESTTEDGA